MHDTLFANRHAGAENGPYAAGAVRNAVHLEGRGKILPPLGSGNVEEVAFAWLSLVVEKVQRAGGIHDGLRLNTAMGSLLKGDRGNLGQWMHGTEGDGRKKE